MINKLNPDIVHKLKELGMLLVSEIHRQIESFQHKKEHEKGDSKVEESIAEKGNEHASKSEIIRFASNSEKESGSNLRMDASFVKKTDEEFFNNINVKRMETLVEITMVSKLI